METLSRFLSVLLADDDSDDRMLFEDAVSEINLDVNLQTVPDGEELMRYLLTSAVVLPEILFLDLNMPFKNGFKCLEEIRSNKMFHDVFIIIYSTTDNQSHVDRAYNNGANLFIKKPNSFTELKAILSRIFTLDLKRHFGAGRKNQFVFDIGKP